MYRVFVFGTHTMGISITNFVSRNGHRDPVGLFSLLQISNILLDDLKKLLGFLGMLYPNVLSQTHF